MDGGTSDPDAVASRGGSLFSYHSRADPVSPIENDPFNPLDRFDPYSLSSNSDQATDATHVLVVSRARAPIPVRLHPSTRTERSDPCSERTPAAADSKSGSRACGAICF